MESWTAQRGSGLTSAGGTLVLTTQRLLYEPMRTPKDAIFGPVAKWLGFGELGQVAEAGVDATGSLEQWTAPLHEIASVDPVPGRARLRITLLSGESWEFGISADLWEPKNSPNNAAVRDQAILAIRNAWHPPGPPTLTPQQTVEPTADPLLALRRQAMSSGAAITVMTEGPMRAYVTPDGVVRGALGTRTARPAGASVAPNLVGNWRSDGFGPYEVVTLDPSGAVTGRLELFAALPPLEILNGTWWIEGTSVVRVQFDLHVPELAEDFISYFEFNASFRLTHLGREVVVAESLEFLEDPDGPGELAMRRATQTPRGTWR